MALKKITLIILFLFIAAASLYANQPVIITDSQDSYPLGLYLDILEDKTGLLTFEEILKPEYQSKFIPSKVEVPSYGFTNNVYWVRFSIINNLNTDRELYLEHQFAPMDKIILFIPQDEKYIEKISGDLIPFKNREIKYRNSVFRIYFNTTSHNTYYMRFVSTSAMNLSLKLWKPFYFTEDSNYKEVILGFFYGIMIIMIIYNLMLFFAVRDISYFYYIFYTLAATLFYSTLNGHSFQYLWSNIWWANTCLPFFITLAVALGIQFNRSFLNTKKILPKYDVLLLIFLIIDIIVLLMTFIIKYSIAIQIATVLSIISPLLILICGIVSLVKGNRAARFLISAWSLFLIGTIIQSLRAFAILSDNFFTIWSQQIGAGFEVTLLSLALADRINIMKKEKLRSEKNALALQIKMTEAFARFVPKEFLEFLNKESIMDVELGDQTLGDMTVLFSDIRSFTSISEGMSPQENFNFLNSYLKRIGPIVRSHNGFIDKYIGDAVMALFPKSVEDSINSAIEMQKKVIEYNEFRKNTGYKPIAIGIGLHRGNLMLGTIGEENRMETTVISDAVNLASRMEGLTKMYGAGIIISGQMLEFISDKNLYSYRTVDKVKVKGKAEPVTVVEIIDGSSQEMFELKKKTKSDFEKAVLLYQTKEIYQALDLFEKIYTLNGNDKAISLYIDRCRKIIKNGIPDDWDFVEKLDNK